MGRKNIPRVLLVILCAVVILPSVTFAEASIDTASITVPSVVTQTPPLAVVSTPDVILTAFSTGDRLEVAELFNQSSVAVDMGAVTITTIDSTGGQREISLPSGWLLSRHYITFAYDTTLIRGAVPFATSQTATSGNISTLVVSRQQTITQSINIPPMAGNSNPKDNYLWAQHRQRGNVTLKQTGDFATDFVKKTSALVVEGTVLYRPPRDAGGLTITEIHPNPVDCAPGTASDIDLRCGDYIKVENTSDKSLNLTQYRLRVGSYGDTASLTNAFNWQQSVMTPDDELILNAHDFLTVHLRDDLHPLSLAATGKYVWIEDYFGTVQYDVVQYPDMTLAKYNGLSWGIDSSDHTWKAMIPSPTQRNNQLPPEVTIDVPVPDTGLVPCGDNQYRSTETNRCRNLIQATVPAPCRDGQYRSEETGRCRSIVATVSSALKPCADDQFRNPETGRCKKIASTDDILQACEDGWERNPETNRCRKIKVTEMPVVPFAVQPIQAISTPWTTWVTIAGIATIALGYGLWEWRQEIGSAVQRVRLTLRHRR